MTKRVRSGSNPVARRRDNCGRGHGWSLNLQGRKKDTRDYRVGISGFYIEEFTGTEEENDRVVRDGEVLIVRGIAPNTRG